MKLIAARINYSHCINIDDFPQELHEAICEVGMQADQLDYTDGDYRWLPDWKLYDLPLTEEMLKAIIDQDEDFPGCEAQYDILDKMQSYVGAEAQAGMVLVMRHILKTLPEAKAIMDAGNLAIYVCQ